MEAKEFEQLENLLKEHSKTLDEKIQNASEESKNASSEQIKKISEETKSEIQALAESYNESKKEFDKIQEQLDANSSTLNRIKTFGSGVNESKKTFSSELTKALSFKEDEKNLFKEWAKNFKDGKRQSYSFNLNMTPANVVKAVGDMTFTASTTGDVVEPDYVPSIVRPVLRSTPVRSLLPQGSTTSNTIYYIYESGGEGCPNVTAEGALKNQIDIDLTAASTTVKKVAGHLKVTEEMLEDIPALQTYLTSRLQEKYRYREDYQLLYGDGTGQNLTGITDGASTIATNPFSQAIEAPNDFTALRTAMAQLMNPSTTGNLADGNEYMADGILMHPVDYLAMKEEKGSDEHYLDRGPAVFADRDRFMTDGQGQLFFDGVPIFLNTAIAKGSFLIGNWTLGAQIFDRRGVNVRFYDQNEDDAIKNYVTIVIEGRLALVTYRAGAFIYESFEDARYAAALT